MKLRKIRKNKKGAIELSMSTIIVVVIGILLLLTGFAFIDKIRSFLGKSIEEIEKLTPKITVQELEKPVTISPNNIKTNQKSGVEVTVFVLNLAETKQTVKLVITKMATGKLDIKNIDCQFLKETELTLDSGDVEEIPLRIIDRGSPLTGGDSYSCTVTATGGDLGGPDNDAVTIEVIKKEGTF